MSAFLSAREVCQRLREAALGVLALKVCEMPDEAGRVAVDIEGWQLLLDFGPLFTFLFSRFRSLSTTRSAIIFAVQRAFPGSHPPIEGPFSRSSVGSWPLSRPPSLHSHFPHTASSGLFSTPFAPVPVGPNGDV
jgi:hypothetical protein